METMPSVQGRSHKRFSTISRRQLSLFFRGRAISYLAASRTAKRALQERLWSKKILLNYTNNNSHIYFN